MYTVISANKSAAIRWYFNQSICSRSTSLESSQKRGQMWWQIVRINRPRIFKKFVIIASTNLQTNPLQRAPLVRL